MEASVFNGNGFVPFSQPPAFSFTQAAGDTSSHGKKRSLKNAGVMPLTVKQISQVLQHPFDDTFNIDGVDVNVITLVGMVINKEEKTTDVSFVLFDGSGRVDVKCWIDGQDMHACTEILTVQDGDYVRVHGHLRFVQGKRSIVAISIRSISDFNEITFHFLECICVHLFNVKSMGSRGLSNATDGNAFTFMQAPLIPPYHNIIHGVSGTVSAGSYAPLHYTPSYAVNTERPAETCSKKVQSIFEEPHNLTLEAGLHVNDVIRRMNGFSRKEVLDSIEFLVNEGMIYSTIDDEHYRAANG